MGSPGTTSAPTVIEFIVAALALAAIGGLALIAKLIGALFHGIPLVGGWVDSHVARLAGEAFHGIEGFFLTALQPLQQEFDYVGATVATWITEVEDSLTNSHSATRSLSGSVKSIQSHTATASGASIQAEINELELRIKAQEAAIAAESSRITDLRTYVDTTYNAEVEASITASRLDAEHNAAAGLRAYDASQEATLHAHIRTLETSLHITIPDAEATIPVALAGTMAYVATLTAEAETCYNPMCSDWNAAKGLLRELEGLVTAAVGGGLLIEAVENPIAAGVAIGNQATTLGQNAIDVWHSLGLPT